MELTLDQALQQAVAAHKEGKLQEAERFYRAILQAQPNDPDANHNLGALAVAVGKPLEAIPLFKLALETNPQREQFWLSYIDALIKEQQFDDAKQVLERPAKCNNDSIVLGKCPPGLEAISPGLNKNPMLLILFRKYLPIRKSKINSCNLKKTINSVN